MMHTRTNDAKDQAKKIQKEIDDLALKAQSSSGEEKDAYFTQIQDLRKKKYELLDEYHHLKFRGDRSDESVNVKAM